MPSPRPRPKANLAAAIALSVAALLGPAATAHAGSIAIDLGRGPVTVHVPADYDSITPTPLVLLLHGYSSSGQAVENWMQFLPLVDELGFLYAYPNGTEDAVGNRFWNATDACCDIFGSGVDDSGYLRALIDEIKALFVVDDARVYFVGHSNGGFMSYRMACEHSDAIAAIASLAGATFDDPGDCAPLEPVDVLQIHGTSDAVISYFGGLLFLVPYPGAVQSVETWAFYNGCSAVADTSLPRLDLDVGIPGSETAVARYSSGCVPGGSGELWTIEGGAHSPDLAADFSRMVIEYFYAHPKPTGVGVSGRGLDISGRTGIALLPNAPNPFNPRTTLRYSLGAPRQVHLAIYDATGRLVRTLVAGEARAAGTHELVWDGREERGGTLASGVYFLRLAAGGEQQMRRIVMAR